jgi:hypothetical protein
MTRALPIEFTQHADAAETAQIARALTQVEATLYETKFEPLKARTFIPVDSSDDPGAEFTTYVMLTEVGVAKLVTSRGMDLPKVNVFRKEYHRQYHDLGASYDYSVKELRQAQFGSKNGRGPSFNLDMSLAKMARKAIDFGLDKVGAIGSATSATISGLSTGIGADVGMLGLLNQTNASSYTPATGAGGSTNWDLKTPDEILADLNGFYTSIVVATREAFEPDVFLLPVEEHRKISTTRMGDGSDKTILQLFKEQNPGVEVERWLHCKGAGTNGVERAVAFKSDDMVLSFKISVPFEQMPVEYRNRIFKTDCMARTAGVVVRYPIAIAYMDGI